MIAQNMIESLGMELLIVAVTLGFAMIIKNHTKPVKVTDKLGKQQEYFDRKMPSPRSTPPRSTSARSTTSPRSTSSSSESSQPARGSRVEARQMPFVPAGRRVAPPKVAWKVADDIINGARDQPGPGFAGRALTLHAELATSLRDRGVRLVDVPWYSKHQPVDLYFSLVQCSIRAGNPQLIVEIVEDMVQQGVARTLYFYECAMKQLAGLKQYHLALRMYDRLVADGFEASAVTLSCLISFAFEVGEVERAVGFFEKLRLISTPSIRAYMTVIRIHANRQDWPASVQTLRDMQCRGVPLDSFVLNAVIATGVASDRLDEVETLLAEFDLPLSDIVSYNTLIKGYAHRCNGNGAASAIGRLRERGLKPNSITFNTAMDAAVRSPRTMDTAWALLHEMRSSGLRPDKYTCSILVKSLSVGHVGPDRISDTLLLLREVSVKECSNTLRSSMYQTMLQAAAKMDDVDLIAQVAMQMRMDRISVTPITQRIISRAAGEKRSASP